VLATELIGADKSMTSADIDDVKSVRNALASVPPNYMKMGANKGVGVKEAITANCQAAEMGGNFETTLPIEFSFWLGRQPGWLGHPVNPAILVGVYQADFPARICFSCAVSSAARMPK
jgi:hypothetical protein